MTSCGDRWRCEGVLLLFELVSGAGADGARFGLSRLDLRRILEGFVPGVGVEMVLPCGANEDLERVLELGPPLGKFSPE